MNEPDVHLGGRYVIDGYPCTIVGIPILGQFAKGYPAEDWGAFPGTGLLVQDDAAGLIHYPEMAGITIMSLDGEAPGGPLPG
jgi:hypothetical protein